jgi:hypothetical protein
MFSFRLPHHQKLRGVRVNVRFSDLISIKNKIELIKIWLFLERENFIMHQKTKN